MAAWLFSKIQLSITTLLPSIYIPPPLLRSPLINFRLLITVPSAALLIQKIPTELLALRVAEDDDVISNFLVTSIPSLLFSDTKLPFKIILSPSLALLITS